MGSLSAALWADNADLADAALQHGFVRGLADGSLPRQTFADYVAQDAFFLECFARGYALGVARSRDRMTLDAFADLLAGVREELHLHADYAERWTVDLAAVEPAPATLAYTDFLLATASLGGIGLICAAMTPCMRLYAHLGQRLAAEGASGPYEEWVTTYASSAFEALAARLETLLDEHARDTVEVRTAYRRAMQLEVDFFSAAAGK
ncbi:MAG: TenA family protein [Actinomycetota bacterium]|jgi:thiaminase/transcriptional activator TenA|nr:TenA family protein [Acidothermales bacterium]MDQ3431337.1 TenA family protein [Actinomycetota bacterium]